MLFAQDDSERTPKMIFENACRLYSESKFNEAIKEYEKVLDYGRVSPALYYLSLIHI